MIVKWHDKLGTSLYDYVVHVTKLAGEEKVTLTRATLDQKLVASEFANGSLEVLSDQGVVISHYDLGGE